MAVESLTFPDPPTLTNGNDGGQDYNLGIRFSVDEIVPCVGVRWVRTPDSVSPPPTGGSHVAAVWVNDTEIRVAEKSFSPTPATDNFDVLFDAPIMLSPAPQLYVVSIFTKDYVFRASGGVEVTSPSGTMQADQGKLAANTDPLTFPASNQPAYYYVSPLIDIGGTPAQGAAAVILDLAVAATGGRASQGAAAAGFGLAVAAVGSAPARGTAALDLGLAMAATGARSSGGSAAVGLNLAVAGSGLRAASGTSALGLGLAVSASGSNGDNGRPVQSFPFTPEPVSGYPWTPRPVKSFQEVES